MSYIVPIQKPTACRNCHFMDRITYDCKLMRTKDYPDFEIQYANCPLIEVPTPHGRLGDLDELIEKYGEWYTEEGTESGYIGGMKGLLEGTPTVIEAEKE